MAPSSQELEPPGKPGRFNLNRPGAQGVALMSRQLIEDELREGRLVQPFGPEMEGKPFHLVYPESRRDDPTVRAVREWVMAVPGGLCEL